jgi:hypothetical protein
MLHTLSEIFGAAPHQTSAPSLADKSSVRVTVLA